MFDIGWQELLVLGAVAMVIFPPREYPQLLRGVVGMLHRLRRMGEDVREGIDEFSQKHLEGVSDEVKRSVGGFGETQRLLRQSAENRRRQIAELESRTGDGKKVKKKARKKAVRTAGKTTGKTATDKKTMPRKIAQKMAMQKKTVATKGEQTRGGQTRGGQTKSKRVTSDRKQ